MRQPCPPVLGRGAGTPPRQAAARSRLGTCAVAAYLVGELGDADRLLEVAGEPGIEKPVVPLERHGAERDDRDPLCPRSAPKCPAASVPSISGSWRSIRITSGRCSAASAIPSAPFCRLERPEPGGAQHVSGELQVLLVVVDDQDERRTRRAWRRGRHRRILGACRSGSCSPRTTTSSVRASGGCSRRDPTSRSRPSAATSTRCSPQSTPSGRTSSSPTSACRRATPTRGSRPPSGCARRTRRSASSCSASTRTRATCSRSWRAAARGAHTSSRSA